MENIAIVKPKKFALPRFYIRNNQETDDMNEELSVDGYIVENVSDTASSSMTVEVEEMQDKKLEVEVDNNARKKDDKTKPTKSVKPSAYNIFIKATCEELTTTHVNMTPRERYALAIQMWNDYKRKN